MKVFLLFLFAVVFSINTAHGQNLFQKENHQFKGLNSRNGVEFPNHNTMKFSPNTLITVEDSSLSYQWDTTANDWVLSTRSVFSYNSKGNTSEYIYSWFMSETGQWYNAYKTTYEYNQNDQNIRSINYSWGFMTNAWTNSSKTEFTYGSNNEMVSSIQFHWDEIASQWKNSTKTEYSYNAQGNTTEYLYYQWDSTSSNWVKDSKSVYSYDNNNQNTGITTYVWSNQNWVESSRSVYEYSGNNITLITSQNWDIPTQTWINQYKTEKTYDANNVNTVDQNYIWNTTTQQWDNFWKYNYTYDANSNLIEDRSYIWNVDKNAWDNGIKTVYYHSQRDINTGVTYDDISLKIGISPNPTKDMLFIEGNVSNTKAQIFSFDGQLLLTADLNGVQSINVAKLPDGAYLLQLSSESGKITKKFIKIK